MVRQTILAFFESVFPAILFNIDRKKIIWAGLSGALGWIVYSIIFYITKGSIVASFSGAIFIGIYSELMARLLKTPAFEFLIPGIIPLVPGFVAYTTLRYIVEGNLYEALNNGIETISICGGIAFGIMLSTTIFKFSNNIKKR